MRSATRRRWSSASGLTPDSLVTEVASNDGYLLQHFPAAGIPVLGVEPAANVAEAARARGIRTDVQFLGADTGREIAASTAAPTWSPPTTSSPTFPTSGGSRPGCARWSRTTGMVTLEFPHLLRLIERRQYDTIYHEHFSYLTLLTASRALETAGLRVVDVDELDTHGGSLRVHARPQESGRRADRAGEGGAGRGGGRRACTPSPGTRASPPRC